MFGSLSDILTFVTFKYSLCICRQTTLH